MVFKRNIYSTLYGRAFVDKSFNSTTNSGLGTLSHKRCATLGSPKNDSKPFYGFTVINFSYSSESKSKAAALV